MPAPPPESEPAMVSSLGGVRGMAAEDRRAARAPGAPHGERRDRLVVFAGWQPPISLRVAMRPKVRSTDVAVALLARLCRAAGELDLARRDPADRDCVASPSPSPWV